jgi:SH3-like domain-containing protein
VPLVAGPAVVSASHVNIRSKAGLVGEVLTHVTNGTPVTVVEEIHLKKSGPEEPSAWAKILLPPDTHVWVKSSYLDANNAVKSRRLNLRAGPSESYGVVGTLQKGDTVQVVDTKGDWTQIQAPTNAYAFMAAQYLKQGEEVASMMTPSTANNTGTEMPPIEAMTNTDNTVAAPTTEMPSLTDTNAGTAMTTPTPMPDMSQQPAQPETPQEPPVRIVEHEGIVRSSFSIQAPTRYELVSPENKQIINYLYTPTTNLDLSRYKGLHIIVTGEEGLDERWKNTPVITIQRIQVLD